MAEQTLDEITNEATLPYRGVGLDRVNAAAALSFLADPPANRLEALQGDQHRLTFRFEGGDAFDHGIRSFLAGSDFSNRAPVRRCWSSMDDGCTASQSLLPWRR